MVQRGRPWCLWQWPCRPSFSKSSVSLGTWCVSEHGRPRRGAPTGFRAGEIFLKEPSLSADATQTDDVVDVYVLAWSDIRRGETERLAVLDRGGVERNRSDRDFVAELDGLSDFQIETSTVRIGDRDDRRDRRDRAGRWRRCRLGRERSCRVRSCGQPETMMQIGVGTGVARANGRLGAVTEPF